MGLLEKLKRAKVVSASDKLNETLGKLKKKEKLLTEKASQEVAKAKEFVAAKDKRAAIQCLKRKRLHEERIEEVANFQYQIHEQMSMLEGGEAAAWTLDALTAGAAALIAMNINDVDDIMDKVNEQYESTKQMIETVSIPSGAAALIDEDELEAELEELEGAV